MADESPQSSNPVPECDVLVIGAGPTGLLAANLLKRRGVRVRVVDKRPEASRESRAFVVQARTLDGQGGGQLRDRLLRGG